MTFMVIAAGMPFWTCRACLSGRLRQLHAGTAHWACANWLEWTTPGLGHGSGCQKSHHPDAGSCVGGHDNGDLTGGRLVGKQLVATYRLLQKGLPDLKTSGENQHAEAKKMLLRHVLEKLLELTKLLETFKEAVTELRAPCIESSTIGNNCNRQRLQGNSLNREDYFPAMQQHIIALQAKASGQGVGASDCAACAAPPLQRRGHLEGSSNGPS